MRYLIQLLRVLVGKSLKAVCRGSRYVLRGTAFFFPRIYSNLISLFSRAIFQVPAGTGCVNYNNSRLKGFRFEYNRRIAPISNPRWNFFLFINRWPPCEGTRHSIVECFESGKNICHKFLLCQSPG